MIGAFSKDCWIVIGAHSDFVTRINIASSCSKLRNNFYQHFNLNKWLEYVKKSDWDGGLNAASFDGRRALVDFFISKGAREWDDGLYYASNGGHRALVDFFISKGATYFLNAPHKLGWGLSGASNGGHRDLVDLFISKGANNWDSAIYYAAQGGHSDLVDFFISKGAKLN